MIESAGGLAALAMGLALLGFGLLLVWLWSPRGQRWSRGTSEGEPLRPLPFWTYPAFLLVFPVLLGLGDLAAGRPFAPVVTVPLLIAATVCLPTWRSFPIGERRKRVAIAVAFNLVALVPLAIVKAAFATFVPAVVLALFFPPTILLALPPKSPTESSDGQTPSATR